MKRIGESAPVPVPTDNCAPAWKCKAWGCPMGGAIGQYGDAYCRYHFGAHTSVFDQITTLIKPEVWRYRLVRCVQAANDDWREMCKKLAEQYGRPDLDPLMLGMSLIDFKRYEALVLADMEDALSAQVGRLQNQGISANEDGEVVSPLEMIRRYRAMKGKK